MSTGKIVYFDMDFTDLQVTTFRSDEGRFITGNAAEAVTQGYEFDGRWAATDKFTLGFGGTLLDAHFLQHADVCNSLDTKLWTGFGQGGMQALWGRPMPAQRDYGGAIHLTFGQLIRHSLIRGMAPDLYDIEQLDVLAALAAGTTRHSTCLADAMQPGLDLIEQATYFGTKDDFPRDGIVLGPVHRRLTGPSFTHMPCTYLTALSEVAERKSFARLRALLADAKQGTVGPLEGYLGR